MEGIIAHAQGLAAGADESSYMYRKWLRTHRSSTGGPDVPPSRPARDSAEYQRAHREARQLLAAYLREIDLTRTAQVELSSPSLLPSARIELARRSAA
jgi:hypothetical protein